jgi:exoribonuclease-2
LVNQRQIIQLLNNQPPAYDKNDTALFAVLRDFDAAYSLYNEFQRQMERYWCLRWLQQENIEQCEAAVLRENLVKLTIIPLVSRISSMPETPPNSRVLLAIEAPDLLDLAFNARYVSTIVPAEVVE